jgi:hypothetical protein
MAVVIDRVLSTALVVLDQAARLCADLSVALGAVRPATGLSRRGCC